MASPTAVAAPRESIAVSPRRVHRWPALLLGYAAGAAASWIASAVLTAGHGFDITDEGFYLLSYRWWNVDRRTFTGVQYLYGPIFELLQHDIAALRLFRLVTVLAAHLVLGRLVMRWLRQRRPTAPPG